MKADEDKEQTAAAGPARIAVRLTTACRSLALDRSIGATDSRNDEVLVDDRAQQNDT